MFVLYLRDKYPRVYSKPVVDLKLEYTSYGKQVVSGIENRPRILEHMVQRRNLSLDVMQGYDPTICHALNHHSIYHLYEYESKTKFLDRFPPVKDSIFHEMSTRFLLCRYVICILDDAMRQSKDFELMAMRLNGDIYIGANKTSDQFVNESAKKGAFGGLNFPKMVTTTSAIAPSDQHNSVVKKLRLENRAGLKAMTIFVSSVARAFDNTGNVVEVKTCGMNVLGKLQNLPAAKARNWWLRALLSGADRIVYGLRRQDLHIHEVQEATLDDLTHGHFQFNGSELFSFVFYLFEKIDKMIPTDGEMCLIYKKSVDEIVVKKTTSESLKRSPFW